MRCCSALAARIGGAIRAQHTYRREQLAVPGRLPAIQPTTRSLNTYLRFIRLQEIYEQEDDEDQKHHTSTDVHFALLSPATYGAYVHRFLYPLAASRTPGPRSRTP